MITIDAPATFSGLFPKVEKSTLLIAPAPKKPINIHGGKSALASPFDVQIGLQDPIAIENLVTMYRAYLYRIVFRSEEPSTVASSMVSNSLNCGVRIVPGKFPRRVTLIGALKRLVLRAKTDGELIFSTTASHGEVLQSFAQYALKEELSIK
jgi:hypothetical protein